MTDFLVKCFVKDHDKTEDPQVRTRYGILASIVGICCNLLLFASKLFIGVLVNSVSVMADAFNNLSDAASSIIGFIGVRMAGKPADSDHPFGLQLHHPASGGSHLHTGGTAADKGNDRLLYGQCPDHEAGP